MPKFVKILLIVSITPVTIGLADVLVGYLLDFSISYLPFLLGVVGYTLIYPVFRKPLTSYIIGHELAHIIGIWFSRGKIHSVRIGRRGGEVRADKLNLWTVLLPYILPIYTVAVIGVYLALSILWGMDRYYNWMVFILGFTWAFHFWMTLYVLRQNQPDIRYGGFLFSIFVILTVNILVLVLILVFISPKISMLDFVQQSIERIKSLYLWILKSIKI